MLYLDLETRSQCNLITKGLRAYAEDLTTEVICMAYCWADEMHFWWSDEPFPEDVAEYFASGGPIMAWNSAFEKHLFDWVICPDYNLPKINDDQWRCAMTVSMVNGYPAALGDAASAMGLPTPKMSEGRRLIKDYCAPGFKTEFENDDKALMKEYCETDVVVMHDFLECVRDLTGVEWSEFHLNTKINERGIPVDVPFAEAARKFSDELAASANHEIEMLTEGKMTKATQRKARDAWLMPKLTEQQRKLLDVYKNGEKKMSLDQDHRALLLACDDLDPDAESLLTFMNDAGSSVLKKYAIMCDQSVDSVVHENLIFNGAQTGRFSSRGLQVHNMRRDCYPPDDADDLISKVKGGVVIPNTGHSLGRLLRAAITHPDGLVWVDWSGIESRVAPWLANNDAGDAILDVHRAGEDLYVTTAAGMFHVQPEEVDKDMRQAGKVAVLACGYGGGANALLSMAKNYGMNLSDDEAGDIVDKWRKSNGWAVELWHDFDKAIELAVNLPGDTFEVGCVRLTSDGENFLWCELPSGRLLPYPRPRVEEYETPWGEVRYGPTHQLALRKGKGADEPPRRHTRGANMMQNCTQAIAADLLRDALLRADAAGLDIVLHCHDEIVICPRNEGDGELLNKIMLTLPDWAVGLPLATGGIEGGRRYGK